MKNFTEEDYRAQLSQMKKEELIQLVQDQSEVLVWLEDRITSQKKVVTGRKDQVLKVLQSGPVTVGSIATRIGISSRNVSSQLSYLKKEGHIWFKDQLGRLILQDQPTEKKVILRKN